MDRSISLDICSVDVLLAIALTDYTTWVKMLNIPRFARLIWQNNTYQRLMLNKFVKTIIYNNKTKVLLEGKPHSFNDQPSIPYKNGHMSWHKYGKLHRDNDLPAMVYQNGTQCWYRRGLSHRDNDLPATINSDGTQLWFQNGKLYRDNDRPAIIYPNGRVIYYNN